MKQRPGVFKLLGLLETKGAAANSSAGQFVCCYSAFSMTRKGHIRAGETSLRVSQTAATYGIKAPLKLKQDFRNSWINLCLHGDLVNVPATTAEQSNTHPHNAGSYQFRLVFGLMVKSLTTSTQTYISYLHSRFRNKGGLIIYKYMCDKYVGQIQHEPWSSFFFFC